MPSKKSSNSKTDIKNKKQDKSSNEDFEIIFTSKPDKETVVVTAQDISKKWIESAVLKFDNSYKQYSSYLTESAISSTSLTKEEIDRLALNAQSDLNKIIQINDIVRYYINKDDLIGKVFETIETNISTEYQLSYKIFR